LPLGKNKSLPISRFPAFAEAARDRVLLWRRRAATIAVGALALGMGYGVVFGHNGLTAFAKKREEAKSLQQQMQVLKAENERLSGHVERLQNDPSAIEHEARAQLHYTRTGEVIYTLPANSETTSSDQGKTTSKR
jgi:cell division protein FtsB